MEYKFKVPEDCELIVTREGHNAIIEIVPKQPIFKENKIVVSYLDDEVSISVFKCSDFGSNFDAKCTFNRLSGNLFNTTIGVHYKRIRLATDEEKQLLFDKLKEKCLMFDGKDIVRWRARNGEEYYCVFGSSLISASIDNYIVCGEHEKRYNAGNYFPTKELAEQFKKQYLELLDKFHKNL